MIVLGKHQSTESETSHLVHSLLHGGNGTAFARKTDLTYGYKIIGKGAVENSRNQRKSYRKIGGRLVKLKTARNVNVDIVLRKMQTESLLNYRKKHT